jgi:hypothetical protein
LLQPLAAHITSLLSREKPKTTDISIEAYGQQFHLHKFILAARSPYFAKKLAAAPSTALWKLPNDIPAESLAIALQYLYFSEVALRKRMDEEEERIVLDGIAKISKKLEINSLFESITEVKADRRLVRQRRTEELDRGRDQLESWFTQNIIKNKMVVDSDEANKIRWDRNNSIFADVLLRADDIDDEESFDDSATASPAPSESSTPPTRNTRDDFTAIPIGPLTSRSPSAQRAHRKSYIYPAHRAMLLRSEYFLTMFSSSFREAQETPHLHIITLDCSPAVLEIILTFLYTERADFNLDTAIEVLFAADQLFIEKLKQRAALIISTLGNGSTSTVEAENPRGEIDADEVVDIYEVIRAGWDTRVQRLEEFGARYIAYRLERYIDEPAFAEIVQESARRVKGRQETDTIELVDDIRYYLSDRFRLRFEDSGLNELMTENLQVHDQEEDEDSNTSPKEEGSFLEVPDIEAQIAAGAVRTLDGELAGDEFAQDAINYQILLGKIDRLLENLNLDA